MTEKKILFGKWYSFPILQKSNLAKLTQQLSNGFKFRIQNNGTAEADSVTIILYTRK